MFFSGVTGAFEKTGNFDVAEHGFQQLLLRDLLPHKQP